MSAFHSFGFSAMPPAYMSLLKSTKGYHRFTMEDVKEEDRAYIRNICEKVQEHWKLQPKSVEPKEFYLYKTDDRKQPSYLKRCDSSIVSRVIVHWGNVEEYHLTHLKDISRGSFSLEDGSAVLLNSEQASDNDLRVFSNPQINVRKGDKYGFTLRPKTYTRTTLVIDFQLTGQMAEFISNMKFKKEDWEKWSETVDAMHKSIDEVNERGGVHRGEEEVDLDAIDAQITERERNKNKK